MEIFFEKKKKKKKKSKASRFLFSRSPFTFLEREDTKRERENMRLSMRRSSLVVPGRATSTAALSPPPPTPRSTVSPRRRRRSATSASSSDLNAPPPPALRLPDDPLSHARNAAAIERYVKRFLDEEWRLELREHEELGKAAAAAYRRVVSEREASLFAAASSSASAPPSFSLSSKEVEEEGEVEEAKLDVGDVLLAVASDLSAQPLLFKETFTDAFETANKVAELLVHGLSNGKTECGCVGAISVELMDEAFRFADEEGAG